MSEYNTRKESTVVQNAILGIFAEQDPPLTVRQIFYALTVKGVIEKTENGYRRTGYHLKVMRKSGIIPFEYIADNTRYFLKPDTDVNLEAALWRMQQYYRKDMWVNQQDYVEIWVEKDALRGVIYPVTDQYDVPLFVSRGYGSISFIYSAAEYIKRIRKPTYIYYFGDFDPSGVDAANKIEEGLFEHGADVYFERIAVTQAQIKDLNLPTRETKLSDPRSKRWGDLPSVELDSIPAPILRVLVKRCIERHIDQDLLEYFKDSRETGKKSLANIRKNFVLEQNSIRGGSHA